MKSDNKTDNKIPKPTMSIKEFERKFKEFCKKRNIPVDTTRVESENQAYEEFLKKENMKASEVFK